MSAICGRGVYLKRLRQEVEEGGGGSAVLVRGRGRGQVRSCMYNVQSRAKVSGTTRYFRTASS